MRRCPLVLAGLMAATLTGLNPAAHASTVYQFANITDLGSSPSASDVADVNIAESQLALTVDDLTGGNVAFTISNTGPDAATVAEVYWDDDNSLLPTTFTIQNAGVSFSPGGSPSDLPGGNQPSVNFDADFLASADNDAPHNGVNPGDSVTFAFSSVDYGNIISGLNDRSLRVGLHVIAFDTDGSKSLVTTPPPPVTPVPVPSAALTALLGIGLAAARHRRRTVL